MRFEPLASQLLIAPVSWRVQLISQHLLGVQIATVTHDGCPAAIKDITMHTDYGRILCDIAKPDRFRRNATK
jgi:hypothetical protein